MYRPWGFFPAFGALPLAPQVCPARSVQFRGAFGASCFPWSSAPGPARPFRRFEGYGPSPLPILRALVSPRAGCLAFTGDPRGRGFRLPCPSAVFRALFRLSGWVWGLCFLPLRFFCPSCLPLFYYGFPSGGSAWRFLPPCGGSAADAARVWGYVSPCGKSLSMRTRNTRRVASVTRKSSP